MTSAFDVITRGVDSSGRVVKGTRQNFQFYDRVNERYAEGLLVIVQGSFSFAESSAGTHARAICMDYRTWNLSASLRNQVVRGGRDLMGTMWYRTQADGFDPHLHNNLIGDIPGSAAALVQIHDYKLGLNGLANKHRDRDPYRPDRITNYRYIEDDMYSEADRKKMDKLVADFAAFRKNEHERDVAEAKRDKARFERVVTMLGNTADRITVVINQTKDPAVKAQLKPIQEEILLGLKNDPDVKEKDNPSDDALGEMNMG